MPLTTRIPFPSICPHTHNKPPSLRYRAAGAHTKASGSWLGRAEEATDAVSRCFTHSFHHHSFPHTRAPGKSLALGRRAIDARNEGAAVLRRNRGAAARPMASWLADVSGADDAAWRSLSDSPAVARLAAALQAQAPELREEALTLWKAGRFDTQPECMHQTHPDSVAGASVAFPTLPLVCPYRAEKAVRWRRSQQRHRRRRRVGAAAGDWGRFHARGARWLLRARTGRLFSCRISRRSLVRCQGRHPGGGEAWLQQLDARWLDPSTLGGNEREAQAPPWACGGRRAYRLRGAHDQRGEPSLARGRYDAALRAGSADR